MTVVTGSEGLAGLRILVVEDEVLIAMLLEDLLQELGCVVVGTAANVAQALALLAATKPDAAVLDVNLGAGRVYPVADALNQAAIPFVFITGYGQRGLIEAFRGHASIKKPIDSATFGRELAAGLRLSADASPRDGARRV